MKIGDKVKVNGKGPYEIIGIVQSKGIFVDGLPDLIDTTKNVITVVTIVTELADLIGVLIRKIKSWF